MMSRPQDDRIVAYLDGELADEERVAFERELAESAELKAAVDFERRFGEFARAKLTTEADGAVKSRLLGALREAAEATPETPADDEGARVLKFPMRALTIPAAAAAAVILLVTTGIFDGKDSDEPTPPRTRYFASVMAIDSDFDRRVASVDGDHDERIRKVLQTEKAEYRVWSEASQRKRLAEVEKLVKSCVPLDKALPYIPDDYELVGYRQTRLPLESYEFEVPHIIFSTGEAELSIYVLCGKQADAIENELAQRDNEAINGMNGCSRGGWLGRRFGEAVLIFVSEIKWGKMCGFARQF